ncbi:MAG: pyruvate flavodoxin/ferredoxin oxidoreductase [Deltaproteobacteria bacterium]|nr:pyruvate flavodoxin/ferredoxin oxidoreductase [Deltaproteobacteria bacterium]
MLELIDGNTAVVRAAVDSGCDFFAGYPITPATSILLEAFEELVPRGGKVIQAEDEIASIGMCLAASMAGAKAMTATSGPGLSLYSETIGLAIMGEVPLVIVDAQRMGPATGGATASADGDVQFARWGTSGGYPLIVLAPTDVRTAYTLTRRAFNLAERHRVPVIVLSSKEIALTRQTVDLDVEPPIPVIERRPHEGASPYRPYAVSSPEDVPRFSPVGGAHLVRFTTSIHDETGVITGERSKILAKLTHLERKLSETAEGVSLVDHDLVPAAEVLIVAYGVAAGAARDALERLRAQGRKVSLMVPYTLWPIPETELHRAGNGVRRVVVPEHNFGQYAREVARLLPHAELRMIHRVDGGLIQPSEIIREVES